MNDHTLTRLNKLLARSRERHPQSRDIVIGIARWLGGLTYSLAKGARIDVWTRALTIAALCIRVVEEGDASVNALREARGLTRLFVAGEYTPGSFEPDPPLEQDLPTPSTADTKDPPTPPPTPPAA